LIDARSTLFFGRMPIRSSRHADIGGWHKRLVRIRAFNHAPRRAMKQDWAVARVARRCFINVLILRESFPVIDLEATRLRAARTLIAQIAPHLGADISVQLWNGDVLPLGPTARDDIRLVIRSANTLRRLLLAPKLMTVFELYSAGDLDIVGGSPLDAAERWDHLKALHLTRNLDRKTLLKTAWPFLIGGKGKAAIAAAFDDPVAARPETGRDDTELIQFHYDVSNAFYGLFLDPEMVYSCAHFATPDVSLADAQRAKLDLICRKLRLQPGDRFLDIGCGWGGLICHAAGHYGVQAHGVTLSKAQFDFCEAKIARLGLHDNIKLELRDYRSLVAPGGYDKIAQIEMFEHVGLDNHDRHFSTMHALLRPRGLYLHQASTRMATPDIGRFRNATAYQRVITRFVFPGGELDYIGLSTTNLERHGFEVHDIEGMREHFELTLRHWAKRLWDNREAAICEIGLPRTRLWLLYFALFAKSFERNTVSVFQTLASKRHVGASGLSLGRVT
jgi:cyclopropane-fatty-acyl-phospholipid synthase